MVSGHFVSRFCYVLSIEKRLALFAHCGISVEISAKLNADAVKVACFALVYWLHYETMNVPDHLTLDGPAPILLNCNSGAL